MTQRAPHPRFAVRRTLGAGGFGVVYEALDTERGAVVALKSLQRMEAAALAAFKREFRALADLHHPSLPTLYELMEGPDGYCFTMELVTGVPFTEWVSGGLARHSSELSSTVSRMTPTQAAADGIDVVLEEPSLPRQPVDLPALRSALGQLLEVLDFVHDSGRLHCDVKPANVLVRTDGRVCLLDFGLAHAVGTTSRRFTGTVGYAAPEQFEERPLSPATDLYAVGCMLFEALTGRLPFVGSRGQIARDKLGGDAPDVRLFAEDAPADLAKLTGSLLARSPSDRPRRGLAARGAGAPFVGRDRELDLLTTALDASANRQQVVVIDGPSGLGKSRLVAEACARAGPDVVVLSGKASDRERIAFNAFDPMIEGLQRAAERAGRARALEALSDLFPQLREGSAPAPTTDDAGARARAFDAFRGLLSDLAADARVIVALDDLQWADGDSLSLLQALVREPDAPRVLLVVAHRPDPRPLPLTLPHGARRVELPPLSDAEADALFSRLTGGLPELERRSALTTSRGVPLFVEELARAGETTARSLDDLIVRRASTLDPNLRDVLRLVCVGARPASEAELARAHGGPVLHALTELEALRFVRVADGGRRLFVAYHDRIREAVVGSLSADERRARHAALARAIAASEPRDDAALAEHLVAVGQHAKAAEVSLDAASRAEARYAFETAAELYATALELPLPPGWDEPRVLQHVARALERATLPAAAAAYYERLAAARPHDRRQSLLRAASLYLASGHLERGLGALRDLLEDLGEPFPRTQGRALLGIAVEPFLGPLRDRWRGAERVEERMASLTSAARGLGMIDNLRAVYFHRRASRLAKRFGSPADAAEAWALDAIYTSGSRARARLRARRCAERAESLAGDDPRARAWVSAARGIILHHETPGHAAYEELRRAEGLFAALHEGDTWERHSLLLIAANSLRHIGDIAALRTLFPEMQHEFTRTGDRYALCTVAHCFHILWKADGTTADGWTRIAEHPWPETPGSFHLQGWMTLDAKMELSLYDGSVASLIASDGLRLRELARAPFVFLLQTVRVLAHFALARVYCMHAALDPTARRSRLTARALGALLAREHVHYGAARGHLIAACLHATAGDEGAAVDALGRARARSDLAGTTHVSAVCAHLLGALTGDAHAQDEAAAWFARHAIADVPRYVTSEAPGFWNLLDASRVHRPKQP